MSILSQAKKLLRKEEKAATKKPATKDTAVKKDAPKETPTGMSSPLFDLSNVLTEKSLRVQEKNVVVFRVHPKASKGHIRMAIEAKYGVKPLAIRTAKVRPKTRRRGVTIGYTSRWKKAYVTVKDVNKFND